MIDGFSQYRGGTITGLLGDYRGEILITICQKPSLWFKISTVEYMIMFFMKVKIVFQLTYLVLFTVVINYVVQEGTH